MEILQHDCVTKPTSIFTLIAFQGVYVFYLLHSDFSEYIIKKFCEALKLHSLGLIPVKAHKI
ncbi:CLUMA_CG000327, isoform A [Clunio marinus]|uniref:CLUMA_CG000327, isoform A n=1 Tax=Clunio marinus TaxID=568069 RepID=A0A1J1HF96_9DIPT|nr:CLUMA_CG000327, isoform A [Clunio marinus]